MRNHGARALAVAMLIASGGAAAAEGWTAADLGDVASEQRCVERAVKMFDRFGAEHGHHSSVPSTWSVAGYDLINDDFDGLVTCAHGPDGGTRATLVVYSVGDASEPLRADIAETLKEIWTGL